MSGSAQRYAVLVNGDPPDFITERCGGRGDKAGEGAQGASCPCEGTAHTRSVLRQAADAACVSCGCGGRYGNYGDIYVQLLRDPAREEVWDVFRAFEGSFPEEADIASYDTLIFTGSK